MPKPISTRVHARVYGPDLNPGMCCRAAAVFRPFEKMTYDPADPLAVTVVGWRLSREDVGDALAGWCIAAGGDVAMWLDGPDLRVWLRGPSGEATVWLSVGAVREFHARTVKLVPLGDEFADVDWDSVARGSAA